MHLFDILCTCLDIVLNCFRLGDSLYSPFRVIRLVKYIRLFSRLRIIIRAVIGGVGVLRDFTLALMVIIWPFAIFGTRFIGQNEGLTDATTDEGTTNLVLWGDWPSSMLTLFQIATLDWGDIVRGSIHAEPWLAFFSLPFIVLVGFGITNVFITIVSNGDSNMNGGARMRAARRFVLAGGRAVQQGG